ncbi:penicillin-binding protein 2, partial [Candidatus Sumerlaeota bacterium]|nr:penicillin-binding protein 2 [Candidatus Sumerlaeota bacterium]
MTIMSNQRHRTRIVFIALCCGVLLASLICRLYVVQIVRHEDYLKIANRQHKTVVPIHPRRGNIYDRNLRIVAASTFLDSVYVDCTRLRKSGLVKRLARDLARALDQPYENILKKIDRTGYVPIARMIEPAIADRVRDFCPPKAIADEIVNFERESKRHYPKWPLAYYVLGDVQLDGAGENRGKSGLEYQYNTYIRGKEEQFSALRSAGAPLEWTGDNEVYWAKAFGNELVLTIDESIQHIVERALHEAATEYHVRAGVLVVQNCKTGELLGLASWPECDPTMAFDDWHNRAVEHAFTVGSVMKIFTASSLIETGKLADLDELVNCNNGRDYFPPRRVPVLDAPDCRLGIVPFRMAFYRSSNVGLARMGQRLDRNAYARVLSDFGFGQKSSVDLPGESPGIFRPVSQWTAHSVIVLPFGGEMAVTPVQLVTAVSAVANGGLLVKPRIVKEIRTHDGQVISRTERTVVRRVINPVTCARVLELMESVVGRRTPTGQWEEGTGRGAAISGYRVGGKTGTFQYESNPTSYTASFVAVVPLPDPELTVFCLLD